MQAAYNGKADIVSLLLAAGTDIEAKNSVSKRMSVCLAHVCVYVLYSSIIDSLHEGCAIFLMKIL